MQSLNQFIGNAPQEYRDDLNNFLNYLQNEDWFHHRYSNQPRKSVLKYKSPTSKESPLISLCIPTFKRPGLLKETIESTANQVGFDEYEIVIINNSQDEEESNQIINYLQDYPNLTIRYYVNEENLGMFGNWNQAAHLSKGQWISILSDDDLLTPDCLQKLGERIKLNESTDLILSKFSFFYSPDPRSSLKRFLLQTLDNFKSGAHPYPAKDHFWGCPVPGLLGCAVKKSFFEKIGGFNEKFGPAADYLFLYKASLLGKVEKLYEKLSLYRMAQNTTLNPKTLYTFYLSNYFLREKILSTHDLRFESVIFQDISKLEFQSSLKSKNLSQGHELRTRYFLITALYRIIFKFKNSFQ